MELDFVKWLKSQVGTHPSVAVGIGDDAAVLEVAAARQLIVTSDMLTDGVHFDLREHAADRVGRKALAVNLSDLAAMAAKPMAVFVAINVPSIAIDSSLPRDVISGMRTLADEFQCAIAGGDTNVTEGPLVVAITAVGSVEAGRAWLRDGAKPGDRLLVTGQLGGSLVGHHLDFSPRVAEAMALQEAYEVHAAIDLSDGLALDLYRVIEASGVGAIVDVERIPISPAAATLAQTSGQSPLQHALGDGEDFELLLCVAPTVAATMLRARSLACGLTDIGEIVAAGGLRQRDRHGNVQPLQASGYQHR